ncbi:hypothetical protein Hanom_Chr07g00591161 [Helianthus anomalus]
MNTNYKHNIPNILLKTTEETYPKRKSNRFGILYKPIILKLINKDYIGDNNHTNNDF